jgi:hypothetical protein
MRSALLRRRWLRAAQLIAFLATRVAFAVFFLLISTYCLLAYLPFTYFSFIHDPLLAWLPAFLRWHAFIYGGVLCGVAATLIGDLRRRRIPIAIFLALNLCAVAFLWFWPALAGLRPTPASYIASLISLLPLLLLAVLDLTGLQNDVLAERHLQTAQAYEPVGLTKGVLAAVLISTTFAAVSAARAVLQSRTLSPTLALRGITASLCFHIVIFSLLGLVLSLMWLATRRTPRPRLAYFVGTALVVWLLCTQALHSIVLPAISFEGVRASIFSASVGGIVVLCAAAAYLKWQGSQVNEVAASSRRTRWLWPVLILGLSFSAYAIPAWLGMNDWDFVLQRIAVLAAWMLAVFILGRISFAMRGKAVAAAVLIMCGCTGFAHYAQLTVQNPNGRITDVLDAYAGADVSFKTAYSILSRSVDNNAHTAFYDFLKQHTNLGSAAVTGPADVRLVADLRASSGSKPNIFLFVIDSLRRDFVVPYNPAVDYTPEISRFAQDSVVMQNAFTRYGGTALSEPAIWVSAMQLHKQYVEPFYPMNNLQKLLDTDGYHSYISVDPILRKILRPSSSITELESDATPWGELDFVLTLQKLEATLAQRQDPDKPIFAYSQPQNLHTLTLGQSHMKGSRKEIAVNELRRMDAAFGEFLRFLKQQGLYDNSIIILTSDHGDSYGEFGRYGHSNFLFPEIIRIPLIIRLPPQMRANLVWNDQQVAFNTDITSSLYYLLGHRPLVNKELFGRPLFTQTPQEQSDYLRPSYLIACSYGPVYGMLSNNGKALFIVDAVNRKNYFLDLAQDPLGSRNYLTVRLRDENEALIRHDIGLIDDLYHWKP